MPTFAHEINLYRWVPRNPNIYIDNFNSSIIPSPMEITLLSLIAVFICPLNSKFSLFEGFLLAFVCSDKAGPRQDNSGEYS